MTTLYTHAAVGLGLARLSATRPMPWSYWALAAILPVVPDLDVFSMAAYGSPLGHRGITHSLLFASSLGLVAGCILARHCRTRWWRLAGWLSVLVASHGLLDAMTSNSEKIPLFWPLAGRYGNWGLIPVSDIAFGLPDPWHSRAMRSELMWIWLPMALLIIVVSACRRANHRPSSSDGVP